MPIKQTPTNIRALGGFADKKKKNKSEPYLPIEAPPPPEHFTDVMKGYWNDLAEDITMLGVVTKADRKAMEMYCEAYNEYVHFTYHIAQHGYMVQEQNMHGEYKWKRSAAVDGRNSSWRKCMTVLQEFGLTPSSRAKVNSLNPDNDGKVLEMLNSKS